MKTSVYIDGFNLYYGCAKRAGCKWLDISKLCSLLLPRDNITKIRYFTALVKPTPYDPQKPQRQQIFLRALRTIPNLEIHYGSFLMKKAYRHLVYPQVGGPVGVEVWDPEEKGSDVNLATYLLLDAFRGMYDIAVVVSNDSDLAEPIRVVRNELGLQVGVLNPHPKPSQQLLQVAGFHRPIRQGAVRASQFPPTLRDSRGVITKPADW